MNLTLRFVFDRQAELGRQRVPKPELGNRKMCREGTRLLPSHLRKRCHRIVKQEPWKPFRDVEDIVGNLQTMLARNGNVPSSHLELQTALAPLVEFTRCTQPRHLR